MSIYPEHGFTIPDVRLELMVPDEDEDDMGFGLFAKRDIPRGTLVTHFSGQLVHLTDEHTLSDNARRYIYRVRNTDYFINGEPLRDPIINKTIPLGTVGCAFMVNSSIQYKKHNCILKALTLNAFYGRIGEKKIPRAQCDIMPPVIAMITSRDIRKGEEIVFKYEVTH